MFFSAQNLNKVKDNVVVIADIGINRYHCKNQAADFLSTTKLPVYGTPLGKTVVDETSDRYGGIYVGNLSSAAVKEKVESAKLVLFIGPLSTDFNSGNFSHNIDAEKSIKLHFDHTEVGFATYARTGMKALLPKLAERLKDFSEKAKELEVPEFKNKDVEDEKDKDIKHEWLWWRFGKWFKTKDLIITESGSVSYGVIDLALPKDSNLLAQKLWASIGWSMGATHGATLARQELEGEDATQTILFIGDGSFQMTAQELSSMIRSKIKPIIFVIVNKGYTIERLQDVDHKEAESHNIVDWDYKELLKVFGVEDVAAHTHRVTKEDQLGGLLDDDDFRKKDHLQLVEVVVERDDAPPALVRALEAAKEKVVVVVEEEEEDKEDETIDAKSDDKLSGDNPEELKKKTELHKSEIDITSNATVNKNLNVIGMSNMMGNTGNINLNPIGNTHLMPVGNKNILKSSKIKSKNDKKVRLGMVGW